METRPGQKYQEYVRQKKNKVSKLTKQAQKEYEKTVARQVRGNPKKFWEFVKSKTKSPSNIPDLHKEDNNPSKGLATDNKEKADILAEFYSSVFTKEPPGPIPEPKNSTWTVNYETQFLQIYRGQDQEEVDDIKDIQIPWDRPITPQDT